MAGRAARYTAAQAIQNILQHYNDSDNDISDNNLGGNGEDISSEDDHISDADEKPDEQTDSEDEFEEIVEQSDISQDHCGGQGTPRVRGHSGRRGQGQDQGSNYPQQNIQGPNENVFHGRNGKVGLY